MTGRNSRFDIERSIMEKSVRDDAFRALLMTEPKAALEREIQTLTGQEVRLPENVTVTVHEETPENIHLVVPPKLAGEDEITDADLGSVAGGSFFGPSIIAPFQCG